MNLFKIGAWFGTYSYFAEYLHKAKGMDAESVSYMLLIFGVLGVVASFIAGKTLSRSPLKTTIFFLSGTIFGPVLLQFQAIILQRTLYWLPFGDSCMLHVSLSLQPYMLSATALSHLFHNTKEISDPKNYTANLQNDLNILVLGFNI